MYQCVRNNSNLFFSFRIRAEMFPIELKDLIAKRFSIALFMENLFLIPQIRGFRLRLNLRLP